MNYRSFCIAVHFYGFATTATTNQPSQVISTIHDDNSSCSNIIDRQQSTSSLVVVRFGKDYCFCCWLQIQMRNSGFHPCCCYLQQCATVLFYSNPNVHRVESLRWTTNVVCYWLSIHLAPPSRRCSWRRMELTCAKTGCQLQHQKPYPSIYVSIEYYSLPVKWIGQRQAAGVDNQNHRQQRRQPKLEV